MSTKTTSLTRLRAALDQHGWTYTATDAEFKQKTDEVEYIWGKGHHKWVTRPGTVVTFSNDVPADARRSNYKSGILYFTASGALVSIPTGRGQASRFGFKVSESYEFKPGQSLTTVLAAIEKFSARATQARLDERNRDEIERATTRLDDANLVASAAQQEWLDQRHEVRTHIAEVLLPTATPETVNAVLTFIESEDVAALFRCFDACRVANQATSNAASDLDRANKASADRVVASAG